MHTTGPRDLLLAGATVASSVAAIVSGCNAREIRDVHNQQVEVRAEAEAAAQKADEAAKNTADTNKRVKGVEQDVFVIGSAVLEDAEPKKVKK
jgi:hypothetical protein